MFDHQTLQELTRPLLDQQAANQAPIALAICDDHCELLYFVCQPGIGLHSTVLAQNKAYTAARDRQATRDLGNWSRESGRALAYWSDLRFTSFAGGVPLWHNGAVVAAVGISGLSEGEDHQLASQPAIAMLGSSPLFLIGSSMITTAHGDASVIWHDNVCISTLNGAFNEEGIANWLLLLQQSWVARDKPPRWAYVLDMFGWQGRTPETTALVRKGVAWTNSHGLSCAVLITEAGPASIFIRMNQTANPVIPVDADITICQSYEECVAQLQRRQFAVSLQQLQPGASASRPELRAS